MAQQQYTIKSGDTLSGIGQQFGLSYQDIAAWNGIANPNVIRAGDTIKLYNPASQPATPQTTAQVQPFLDQAQQNQFIQENTLTNPYAETTPQTDEEIQSEINTALGSSPIPTAPNLEQTFQEQRQAMGLEGLEKQLTDLKNQEMQLAATRRLRLSNEKNQRVGMGVIAGRSSEIEQQTAEEADFIGRQISYTTNQIQSAYSTINTIMSLKSQDYNNAVQTYNMEFERNLTFFNLFKQEKKERYDRAQAEIDKQKDAAMSNLQIYMNLIKDGNLFWNTMDQATKVAISKLEVQSGLGLGFMQKLGMDPDKQKQLIGKRTDSSGNDYIDYMVTDPSGNRKVESMFLGKNADFALQSWSNSMRQQEINLSKKATGGDKDANGARDAFFKDTQGAIDNLNKGYTWGQVWNSLKNKYPGVSNADIDLALGVPSAWIKSGKPGYEWWNQNK